MKRAGMLLTLLISGSAFAHGGGDHVHSLAEGLWHPLSGADHLLAMVGVGLLAASIGGRARWQLPLAFVGAMTMAAIAALTGLIGGAPVEHWIAFTVVLIGVPLAFALKPARLPLIALIAACGALHGHAHGVELPMAASALPYVCGFVLSTALLHATGAFAGMALHRIQTGGIALTRYAGAVLAVSGLVLMLG